MQPNVIGGPFDGGYFAPPTVVEMVQDVRAEISNAVPIPTPPLVLNTREDAVKLLRAELYSVVKMGVVAGGCAKFTVRAVEMVLDA